MQGSCLCGAVTLHRHRAAAPGCHLPLHAMPQDLGPFLGRNLRAAGPVSPDPQRRVALVSLVGHGRARLLRRMRRKPVLETRRRSPHQHRGRCAGWRNRPAHRVPNGFWRMRATITPPRNRPDHLTGSCLCGANHFTLPGPMGAVGACHCTPMPQAFGALFRLVRRR